MLLIFYATENLYLKNPFFDLEVSNHFFNLTLDCEPQAAVRI